MGENVFDKLDKQNESIEKVADKLEGVSVQDLYALAKRTWDYKDYETAQKYYNHISLLAPLEWRAPFYASLCGCLDFKEFPESIYCPSRSFDYYVATIDYIVGLDNTESGRAYNICEATKILLLTFQRFIDVYKKSVNKNIFDEHWPQYKENILKAYFNLIVKIEEYEDDNIKEVVIQAINEYLSFIKEFCTYLPATLTREKLDHFITISDNADKEFFDNMKYEEKPVESEKALTEEQKVNIKVKGKCYLRYKDKVFAKRRFNNNLICGIILALLATVYMGLLLTSAVPWTVIIAVVPFVFGILFIIKAVIQRKRIKIDSLLNFNKRRYRLTSENKAVCEGVFSPFKTIFWIISCVYPFSFLVSIILFAGAGTFAMISGITLCAVISLIQFVLLFLNIPSYDDATKEFDYEGKTYQFKDER